MTHDLDTSRAPRGTIAATNLVKAAATIGDLSERHYLELKGPGDLSSKRDKAKIAKFILGAANRMPDRAAGAFEGCAVMIIGITENGVVGVPPVEMLELSQVIQPFLGVEGPRWDVVYVPVVDSKNVVLVVIVEPPEEGQPAFLCRANGDGLTDGRVYIRADGETREANSAEQDLLAERGRALSTSEVDLAVSIAGDISPVEYDSATTIDEYTDRTRAHLLAELPRRTSSDETGSSVASLARGLNMQASLSVKDLMGSTLGKIPEDRSEDEYRAEIDEWEEAFRAAWPSAVERLLGRVLSPVVIRLENRSNRYLEELQVTIHLEGAVRGIEFDGYDDDLPSIAALHLPQPPRSWGPRPDPSMSFNRAVPAFSAYSPPISSLPSRLGWSNSGSVDLTLEAGDLRPKARETFDEQEVVLVLWTHQDPAPVNGTWQITARGHHHVFTGDLEVSLSEPTDAAALLRSILALGD